MSAPARRRRTALKFGCSVDLAQIRANAQRLANSTNYEAQPNTPTKQLARLIVALVDHIELQPAATIGSLTAALATVNDLDRPHWSVNVETR